MSYSLDNCQFTPRDTPRDTQGGDMACGPWAARPPNVGRLRPGAYGIHWLRATFPVKELVPLRQFVQHFFGQLSGTFTGWWHYENREQYGELGVNLLFNIHRVDASIGVCLDVNGRALDSLTENQLQNLCDFVYHHGGRASRIDLFFDDVNFLILPSEINHQIDTGKIRMAGFRLKDPRQVKNCSNGELRSDAIYFGKRGENGSGKYYRIYDKRLDPDNPKECIRWEIELTDKHSAWTLCQLGTQPLKYWPKILKGILGSSIDFFVNDVETETHLDRLERAEFWKTLLDLLDEYPIRLPKIHKTIIQTINWLNNSVSGSLAMIRKFLIHTEDVNAWYDFLKKLVALGREKLSQRHENMIKLELARISLENAHMEPVASAKHDPQGIT